MCSLLIHKLLAVSYQVSGGKRTDDFLKAESYNLKAMKVPAVF